MTVEVDDNAAVAIEKFRQEIAAWQRIIDMLETARADLSQRYQPWFSEAP